MLINKFVHMPIIITFYIWLGTIPMKVQKLNLHHTRLYHNDLHIHMGHSVATCSKQGDVGTDMYV